MSPSTGNKTEEIQPSLKPTLKSPKRLVQSTPSKQMSARCLKGTNANVNAGTRLMDVFTNHKSLSEFQIMLDQKSKIYSRCKQIYCEHNGNNYKTLFSIPSQEESPDPTFATFPFISFAIIASLLFTPNMAEQDCAGHNLKVPSVSQLSHNSLNFSLLGRR